MTSPIPRPPDAVSRTVEYASRDGGAVAEADSLYPEGEANIILIAHPDEQLLGTRYCLSPGSEMSIGRSSAADVSLAEVPSVSREHALLRYVDDGITLEDLGSTNGTFINDRPIDAPTRLRSGDRFQIGAVHFKFLHERDIESAYHDALYQLAVRDGLTGLYNRRRFEEEIEREVNRARRHAHPLALILFDIDRFKQVNDRHGHICGDAVLQQVASRCAEALRQDQILARVGGEEFAILCHETDAGGATTLAEKLRLAVKEAPFHHQGVDLRVTCSFGVAELAPANDSGSQLYERADRALYAAKESGRDRVATYGEACRA